MKDCSTFAVETARGAENRTKREDKIAEDLQKPVEEEKPSGAWLDPNSAWD
jgi:hypothetical protein